MSNTHFSDLSSIPASSAAIRRILEERTGSAWCLFLDRDGVINRQVVGDYVRNWKEFEWLPGALPAIRILRRWAPFIVVATNQQGIGKGLMSLDDVSAIHRNMQAALTSDCAPIDDFQVCPHLEAARCPCRKPRPGLLLDWLRQHPGVDPALSIMVGDSRSDMQLARNVAAETGGCVSIHIGGHPGVDSFADASFNSLQDFAFAVHTAGREHGS